MWGWLPTVDGEWVILGLGGSGTSPTKQWELVGGAGLWRRSGNWWRRPVYKDSG